MRFTRYFSKKSQSYYWYNDYTKEYHYEKPEEIIKKEKEFNNDINDQENRVFIYTDGSCIKFKNGITKAGYGIYIPKKNIRISEPLSNQKQTNNRAELTSILECVRYLNKDELKKELVIITDSAYSMYIFDKTGENYEKNNFMKDGQQVLNKDLVIKALKMKRAHNVKLVKVRAHTLKDDIHSKNNEVVDKLAKSGAYKHKSDFEFDEDLEDKNLDTSIYTKYHEVYQKLPDEDIKIDKNITMNDIFEYDECTEKVASTYKSRSRKKNLSQWFIPVKK